MGETIERVLLVKSKLTRGLNGMCPPLGILYLASVLEREGRQARVLDTRLHREADEVLARSLDEFRPQLFGLSVLTPEADLIGHFAGIAKAHAPGVPVVVGGPHTSAYVEETLADPNVDALVLGEGERTLPELARAFESGSPLEGVEGIAFRRNGGIVRTPPRPPIRDLDSVPFPVWERIDLAEYHKYKGAGVLGPRRFMTVLTSRGCPYGCIYCASTFGKVFRGRSPGNVADELEIIRRKLGISEIEILDEIFNCDHDRALGVCDEIIRRRLDLRLAFMAGLRPDLADEELLARMKEAGTVYIQFGFDTGSERLQKTIGRNLKLGRAVKAIAAANKLGICSVGTFILGFPGETAEDMRATLDVALQSRLTIASFLMVMPWKGTRIWEAAATAGKGRDVPFGDYNVFYNDYDLAAESNRSVRRFQRWAHVRYYFSARRILRVLRLFPQRRYLVTETIHVLGMLLRGKRAAA